MKTAAEAYQYLDSVEPGISQNVSEWIAEGWQLETDPTPEQIVAALLMEASFQDGCVEKGESSACYPKRLRNMARHILQVTHPSLGIVDDEIEIDLDEIIAEDERYRKMIFDRAVAYAHRIYDELDDESLVSEIYQKINVNLTGNDQSDFQIILAALEKQVQNWITDRRLI